MPSETARTAILLLAHGTPNALGEMADYLRLVTGGRPLPNEVIEELQHRYALIGLEETPGAMPPPLTRWTLAQRDGLQALLVEQGRPVPVYAAMRNWHPLIAEVVQQIRADGITHLLTLCLAPQNSRTSIGLYRRALTSALASSLPSELSPDPLSLTFIEAWSEEPDLITAFAQNLAASHAEAAAATGANLPVLFTAHSVPCRTIMSSAANSGPNAGPSPGTSESAAPIPPDPYPVEAKRTAELVFQTAFKNSFTAPPAWFFAFQSQGVAGGPWIGPTVEDTLAAISKEGYPGVVLQPIGFVCDHVEILYDIDIAFQQSARELNLRLFRPASLNDSPLLTNAMLHVLHPYLASSESQLSVSQL